VRPRQRPPRAAQGHTKLRRWDEARRKVETEGICRARDCVRRHGLQAAHLAHREYDIRRPLAWPHEWKRPVLVHPDRIVPLCPEHHRAYDAHDLDLLGLLTTEEETQLVADLGLELARKRVAPSDYREPIEDARRQSFLREPCRVCGDELTPNGRTCNRCERSLEEERGAA
jgi:hypothetical protein